MTMNDTFGYAIHGHTGTSTEGYTEKNTGLDTLGTLGYPQRDRTIRTHWDDDTHRDTCTETHLRSHTLQSERIGQV